MQSYFKQKLTTKRVNFDIRNKIKEESQRKRKTDSEQTVHEDYNDTY